MTDNTSLISSSSLDLLDWNDVISLLHRHAHFEHTVKLHKQIPQLRQTEEINHDYHITSFFITNLESFHSLREVIFAPLPQNDSAYNYLPHLEKSRVLKLEELNTVAKIIESASTLYKSLPEHHPKIFKLTPSTELGRFVREFRNVVGPEGEINFEGHPLLKGPYKELKNTEKRVREGISEVANSRDYSSRLQFSEHDIINDRYVLAVRSDSYESKLGPVISRSSSGMTLFVEPYKIRDLSNKRLVLLAEIESIIEQICTNFSLTLSEKYNEILALKNNLLYFDDFYCRAKFSIHYNLTQPVFLNHQEIDLKGLFHPLIENSEKNDLKINKNKHGLILSGPNTGGKTVLLKSMTLSLLMANKGLFVPAQHCRLYPYQQIFYFSNDFQDISEGLSSFASESLRYLEMVQKLRGPALIVIDEIFNSTSSEEASSLAKGLIELILKKSSSKIIISTHHQFLKTLTHQNKDFLSGHMLFDPDKNKPLYKLSIGSPGSSLAFLIFNNLVDQYFSSLDELKDITDIAQEVFDKKQVSYESLLQELSQKNAELTKLLTQNRELNSRLKNQEQSMHGLLELEKQKKLEGFEAKMKSLLSEAQELKKDYHKLQSHTFDKKVAHIKTQLSKLIPQNSNPEQKRSSGLGLNDFKQADYVIHLESNKRYRVTNIDTRKKKLLITSGPFRLWVTPDQIAPIDYTPPKKEAIIITPSSDEGDLKTQLDCRGMRLEDFKQSAEKCLDLLLRRDLPFVILVHGHGDGILKKWLRKRLEKDKAFAWSTPEGNDGATEIKINE